MQVDDEAWLLIYGGILERREARWLRRLADFDAARGWEADGQTSCVDWLVQFARMDRATASEKLEAAHALHRQSATADGIPASRPPTRSE